MSLPGFSAETSLPSGTLNYAPLLPWNDPSTTLEPSVIPAFMFECALLNCPLTHPNPPPGKVCIINGCYPTGFGWCTTRVRCLYLCFPTHFW